MALSDLNIRLILNDKKFQSGLSRAQKSMKKFGRNMDKVGKNLSRNLTLPIAALGAVAVKTFADFEQEMASVKAVSGATEQQFKELEATAKELGRTTRFTAKEVAGLELAYSKLGLSPDEINAAAKATLNLAQASGEDLAKSATVAAGVLNSYNISANDTGRVTDVMAKAFSTSALDLEKFSVALPKIAATANAVGISFERTSAILGVLASNTVEASTAGTSSKKIFVELAKSGMTYQQAMDAINNSTNKVATAQKLFGDRAFTAALLLAQQGDEVNRLEKEYLNAEGSAAKMAATMDNTLKGAMLRMKSALEGAGIEIGTVLAPAITKITQKIAALAGWFSNLSDGAKKTILIVAGIAAAIGPVLLILGKLSFAISSIVGFVRLWKAAQLGLNLAMLANPIGLIITGIALLVGAIVYLVNKVGGLENAWELVKAAATATIKTISTWLRAFVKLNIEVAKAIGAALIAPFKAAAAAISGDFEGAKKIITDAIVDPFEAVKDVMKDAAKETKSYWGEVATLRQKQIDQSKATEDATKAQKELNKVTKEAAPIAAGATGGTGKRKQISIFIAPIKEADLSNLIDTTQSVLDFESKELKITPNLEMDAALEQAKNFAAEMARVITDALNQGFVVLGETIGDMISGGGFGDVMKGMVSIITNFMNTLGKMFIAIGVAQMGVKAAIKTLNPLLAIGAGVALIAAAAVANNFMSKGFATGTASAMPGLRMVGEHGPELVNFQGGESVLNANRTKGMMGGEGQTLTAKVKGRDLLVVLERATAQNKRV